MPATSPERLAAGLLAAEGAALVVVAGWELVALVSGDTDDTASSIALLVLTLVGAAAVVAFGVATARGQSWGRSGGIVTQLLMLAIALGAATGPSPSPGLALALVIPALAGLVLLLAAARSAGLRAAGADAETGDSADAER